MILPARSRAACIAAVAALALSGCAGRTLVVPTGAGEPLANGTAIADSVFGRCLGLSTLTAEIRLSGHAGRQKLRGRLIAGFAAPSSIRLEAVAPFGPPVFILAATAVDSTLILPRDGRVLRQVAPAEMIEALAGIALPPADLLPLLAGCLTLDGVIGEARQDGSEWVSFRSGARIAYLEQRAGHWQLAALAGPGLTVEYAAFSGSQPALVRLRDAAPGAGDARVDLSLALSQVELNVPVPSEAFRVVVPADASPISLEELRQSGPMRDQPSAGGSQ